MSYTDKELIRASQIAYFTINSAVFEEVDSNIKNSSYTLFDLYNYSDTFKKSVYEGICNLIKRDDYKSLDGLPREEILSYAKDERERQIISEKLDIIDDIKNGKIGSWQVVSYVDNNTIGTAGTAGRLVDGKWVHDNFSSSGDGMSAVVFETGNGQALTAFRGSENWSQSKNLISDWLSADFGLALPNDDTNQQKSVYKYMRDYVLNLNYDNLALTGHSLGGNLAMHAAVAS